MESIMKDDHQNDHLEVAVQTPDGTFYKVIPSQFLWTTVPHPYGRQTYSVSFTSSFSSGTTLDTGDGIWSNAYRCGTG